MTKSEHSPEAKIKLLLFLLVKSLKQDLEQRLKTAQTNIGVLGFGVLYLLKKGEQTIASLSQKLILAPATLVPVVNNLEKKGLMKRRPDKTDKRSHPLSITASGLELIAALPCPFNDDPLIKELKLLSSSDRKKLYQILNNLNQAIIGTNKLKSILNLCLNQ